MSTGHGEENLWDIVNPLVRCRQHTSLTAHWNQQVDAKAQGRDRAAAAAGAAECYPEWPQRVAGRERGRPPGAPFSAAPSVVAGAGAGAGADGGDEWWWRQLAGRVVRAAGRFVPRRLHAASSPPPAADAGAAYSPRRRAHHHGRGLVSADVNTSSHRRAALDTSSDSSIGSADSSTDSGEDSEPQNERALAPVHKQGPIASRASVLERIAGAGDRCFASPRRSYLRTSTHLASPPPSASPLSPAPSPMLLRDCVSAEKRPATAPQERDGVPGSQSAPLVPASAAYAAYVAKSYGLGGGGVGGGAGGIPVGAAGSLHSWSSGVDEDAQAVCPVYPGGGGGGGGMTSSGHVLQRRVPPASVMASSWWRNMEANSPAFAAISQRFHVIAHAQARDRLATNMARLAALQEQEQASRESEDALRYALGMPALARWAQTKASDSLGRFLLRTLHALLDLALELMRHTVLIGWVFLGVFNRLIVELMSAKRSVQASIFFLCMAFALYVGVFGDLQDLEYWFWE